MAGTTRQYDAMGNTVLVDGQTHVYSDRGRLTEVRLGPTVQARYAYNGLGERVCVATGGTCPSAGQPGSGYRQYIYDASGHLLGEYDASGSLLAEHVWLGDTPIAVLKPASTAAQFVGSVMGEVAASFVHPDHLDTPRVVVNASTVAEHREQATTWRRTGSGTSAGSMTRAARSSTSA